MRLNIDKDVRQLPRLVGNTAFRLLTRSVHPYQPVYLNGRRVAEGDRDCERRWAAVEGVLTETGAQCLTDYGCAEGFFVRRAAERGCFALGVEADVRRLLVAQWSLTLDRVENFGLIHMRITPESVQRLPTSDVSVCLSLIHHILYEHGRDYTLALLGSMKRKTGIAMVIEMGQSDEHGSRWAKHLPDMGADPHEWIRQFLLEAGFAKVEKTCEVPSYGSPARRATFAAYV